MKLKRISTLLIALVFMITAMPLLAIPATAATFSGDGWSFTDGTLTVTTNAGTTAWRTGRGLATFRQADITEVIIEDGVTSIGQSAFSLTGWFNNQPDGLIYAGRVAYTWKGPNPMKCAIIKADSRQQTLTASFFRSIKLNM